MINIIINKPPDKQIEYLEYIIKLLNNTTTFIYI